MTINSIQCSLFYIAQLHKLQICLKGFYNLYTYNFHDLWPHRKNYKEIEKTLSRGKKGRNLPESKRGGSVQYKQHPLTATAYFDF